MHITSTEFSQLFENYKSQFVIIARSYVRDAMVAEDLVMNSFISFWENRDKIESSQNVPSYILISIKRRCLNWLRDQNIHLKIQENIHDSTLRLLSSRIQMLEANNPNSLFLQEISAITERELKKMPDKTRRIFIASRFEEKSYNEICELFGLSFNQVSFEIRKATHLLRLSLKDYLPLFTLLNIFPFL